MIKQSAFKAPWWLRNRHMQTIWAGKIRRQPRFNAEQKRLITPDNDFLDLIITADQDGPVVLVLHGLQGSIKSRYAGGLMQALSANGYTAVLMHFRGCSGEINRQSRLYHSGETGDVMLLVEYLKQRFPARNMAAVGFSLGGNVLLKLLGELGSRAPFASAAAVSAPMCLDLCANRINRGVSKLYQSMLVKSMRQTVIRKYQAGQFNNIDMQAVRNSRTFWDFDDAYTAPMHGFNNARDYYQKCSSRQFLKQIQTPTLILHALDDPFTSEDAIPAEQELSTAVYLELSRHGGHVGFVNGAWPWQAQYWAEQRIIRFFRENIEARSDS